MKVERHATHIPATLALGLLLTLAFTAHAGELRLHTTETLLTLDGADQWDAATNGLVTVFTDMAAGNKDIGINDENGQYSLLMTGPWAQEEPDIYGNYVVWTDSEAGNKNIILYDLALDETTIVTFDGADDYSPVIGGDYIVYITTRSGNEDIYLYQISAQVMTPVAVGPGDEMEPSLDGNLVAWSVLEQGSYNVWATEVSGSPFPVDTTSEDERLPSVSNGKIAYLRNHEIKLYDHASGQTTQLTFDGWVKYDLVLEAGNVFWKDFRAGAPEIWMLNIEDTVAFQLTNSGAYKELNDVSGNRSVFSDDRAGNENIFAIDFYLNHAPDVAADDFEDIVGEAVTLTAVASDDDGHAIEEWLWALDPPPGSIAVLDDPSLPAPSFVPDVLGVYTATVAVRDTLDWSEPDTVFVTVISNQPPWVSVLVDTFDVTTGATVVLGASAFDPDYDPIEEWLWTLDPPPGSTASLSDTSATHPWFVADVAGEYVVTVKVRDPYQWSAPDTVVVAANLAPVVVAMEDFGTIVGRVVRLGAVASDADGHTLEWLWTLVPPGGSGAVLDSVSHTTPSFVADVEGQYLAMVKVRDPTEWSEPDTVVITAVTMPRSIGVTISASETDPYVNTGAPSGVITDLYLWLEYVESPADVAVFQGALTVTPPWTVVSFTPMNGFVNFGSATQLQLITSGCPTTAVVMGRVTVVDPISGEICLTETTSGYLEVTDCAQQPWDVQVTGYAADGGAPCCVNCTDVTGVDEESVPEAVRLYAAYPNPFNPQTTIRFDLSTDARAELAVYSVSGHLVRSLVDENMPAGPHAAVWDGRDGSGTPAASGVYFYRLRAGSVTETKKMVLIK